jgi:predicted DNA binding CopG/RHH family protein
MKKPKEKMQTKVSFLLDRAVLLKVKTRAFNTGVTMQKFLSELVTKALKE